MEIIIYFISMKSFNDIERSFPLFFRQIHCIMNDISSTGLQSEG